MTLTVIIIFSTLIFTIIFPYAFNILKLKDQKKIEAPSEGLHVKLSKGRIYYRYHEPKNVSSEDLIVLVHGFSTPSFVWNGILQDLLATGNRVLSYDHYGRGFSDRPKESYSLKFYVDTLEELLDNLEETSDIHIVGYSMGGPISAMFSHQNKEKIKSLNLIAPAGYIPEPHWTTKLFLKPIIGEYFFTSFPSVYKKISASETKSSNDPKAINEKEFEGYFTHQTLYSGFTDALLSTARNFNMTDSSEAYKKIGSSQIPSQVIWGSLDRVVPISGFEGLKRDIPQIILREIKEGTHDITYRQPSQVGKFLYDFISKK